MRNRGQEGRTEKGGCEIVDRGVDERDWWLGTGAGDSGASLGRQENGGVWMAPGTTWAFPTASTDVRATK